MRRRVIASTLAAGTITAFVYNQQHSYIFSGAALRLGRDISVAAKIYLDYTTASEITSELHHRNAQRLVQLFRKNGGIYIKLGQHMNQLEYLLPNEYVQAMYVMLFEAPKSSYEDVLMLMSADNIDSRLIQSLDKEPIASASLAQVHVSKHPETGEKVAVKVQHRGLLDTCKADIFCIETVIRTLYWAYPNLDYRWIIDQVKENLPQELNFIAEGKNADRCRSNFQHVEGIVVPEIFWDYSSKRVLCMRFETGFPVSDVDQIRSNGLKPGDVAAMVSGIFYKQIFSDGFVHCDPHPGNLLVRPGRLNHKKPEIVILDHGLYTELTPEFRFNYSSLWYSILMGDDSGIQEFCELLNVGEMHKLFATILTYKPYREVQKGLDHSRYQIDSEEFRQKATAGVAENFTKITNLLNQLPAEMILLLKTNDCLRALDVKLGHPTNTYISMARYCVRALNEHDSQHAGVLTRLSNAWRRACVEARILLVRAVRWWCWRWRWRLE